MIGGIRSNVFKMYESEKPNLHKKKHAMREAQDDVFKACESEKPNLHESKSTMGKRQKRKNA